MYSRLTQLCTINPPVRAILEIGWSISFFRHCCTCFARPRSSVPLTLISTFKSRHPWRNSQNFELVKTGKFSSRSQDLIYLSFHKFHAKYLFKLKTGVKKVCLPKLQKFISLQQFILKYWTKHFWKANFRLYPKVRLKIDNFENNFYFHIWSNSMMS